MLLVVSALLFAQAGKQVSANYVANAWRPHDGTVLSTDLAKQTGAAGLYDPDNDGLIPIHDLRIDKPTTADTVTGNFYVGGEATKGKNLPYEPRFFMSSYDGTTSHPRIDPAGKWKEAKETSPCQVGDVQAQEGSRVTFSITLPSGSGIDIKHFWLEVEMQGTSSEGVDEMSLVSNTYPTQMTKAGGQQILSNSIVPITFDRPYSGDPDHAYHYVYTNAPNQSIDIDNSYFLSTHAADPHIGLPWKPLTFKDSNTVARKHKLQFTEKQAKHYMMWAAHNTSVYGVETDVYYEWSGITRTVSEGP